MLTQARLKELLSYDPEVGIFSWIVERGKCHKGSPAGCLDSRGYLVITIDRKRYYAHRMAWLYMNGSMPSMNIDHMDGNKSNNKISNIRDVSVSTNAQNLKQATSRNLSTGVLGVRMLKGKYLSQITIDGKDRHLGTFNSPEEAHEAYLNTKRKLHEGCTI